jgi:hypothetical protein
MKTSAQWMKLRPTCRNGRDIVHECSLTSRSGRQAWGIRVGHGAPGWRCVNAA